MARLIIFLLPLLLGGIIALELYVYITAACKKQISHRIPRIRKTYLSMIIFCIVILLIAAKNEEIVKMYSEIIASLGPLGIFTVGLGIANDYIIMHIEKQGKNTTKKGNEEDEKK